MSKLSNPNRPIQIDVTLDGGDVMETVHNGLPVSHRIDNCMLAFHVRIVVGEWISSLS